MTLEEAIAEFESHFVVVTEVGDHGIEQWRWPNPADSEWNVSWIGVDSIKLRSESKIPDHKEYLIQSWLENALAVALTPLNDWAQGKDWGDKIRATGKRRLLWKHLPEYEKWDSASRITSRFATSA